MAAKVVEVKHFSAAEVRAAEEQIFEQSKRIEFYLTEFSVELLSLKMRNGQFEIPSYQRDDTWEQSRKSRFIESLLISLPIPFLFFWENGATGKLEIVDGAQRLRTIQQFLENKLVLKDLETLTALEGMKFADLLESRQRKVENRSVRGIVLNEHADEQSRFEIFDRINTGSKIANNAEVRRGALTGPFLDLVIGLTADPTFVGLAPVPDKTVKLREREELVTRFFAYGDGLEGYQDRPSDFLFSYAKRMNVQFIEQPEEVAKYRKRFEDTMKFVKRVFSYGFRRNANGKATPRTRFEAIAIGSYLALQQKPKLANAPLRVSWLTGEKFQETIGSDGANAIARLKSRMYYVRDRLLGVKE